MKDRIKSYNVEINTLSPVYIGSGYSISKKEYIHVFENGGKVIIPNLYALYTFLEKKGLTNRYIEYMKNPLEKDLYQWLKNNGVKYSDYNEFKEYEIDANTLKPYNARKGINLFVKDGQGMKYVPGSSLKGALRTIILIYKLYNGEIGNYKEMIEEELNEATEKNRVNKSLLSKSAKNIESDYFNCLRCDRERVSNSVNDVFKGLVVSDSEPIPFEAMTLCQKEDKHINGKSSNALPILRECIKPNETIKFTLSVDTVIFPEFTTEYLLEAIKVYDKVYNECFLNKFNDSVTFPTIFLGGGAGFATKTITYALFGERDGLRKVSDILHLQFRNKNRNDFSLGVSPHMEKCTTYKGALYEFGRCGIKIE